MQAAGVLDSVMQGVKRQMGDKAAVVRTAWSAAEGSRRYIR